MHRFKKIFKKLNMHNRTKYFIISAFILAAGLFSNTAIAQSFKFGHIDSQELLASLPEREAAEAQLQKHSELLEGQQKSMSDELNKKYADYLQEKDQLSDLVRATREKDLQDLQQRIAIFNQQAMKELEDKERQLISPIIEKVSNAIDAVGKENNFTYIFDLANRTVVYHSDQSIDVTPMVRKKLGLE